MSEITLGVLRMPPELWINDPMDIAQRHSRYVDAADEIERLTAVLDKMQMVNIRKAETIERLQARVETLEGGIKEGLWWAEQHTDSAVGRRLRDYRKTVEAIREAFASTEQGESDD